MHRFLKNIQTAAGKEKLQDKDQVTQKQKLGTEGFPSSEKAEELRDFE
jgi:hypothetical protein